MTKAAAKNKGTEITESISYEDEANSGFEEADSSAYAIPFLNILQSGSPQCKKSDGAYIEGAEEGHLFNTVSEQVCPGAEGLTIIPCHYKRAFIEWAPRESGGGFVAEHSSVDGSDLLRQTTRDDKHHDVLPNGNYLMDTRSHYCLAGPFPLKPGDVLTPIVISMTSTQIKKSRKWMTVMQNIKLKRRDGTSFTPPMYSHMYHVTTSPEANDQGSWFGWKISKVDVVSDINVHSQAKDFRAAILSGEAKAQVPRDEVNDEDEEGYEEF